MAQRHLFGPDYLHKTPPLEWPTLQLEGTVNDDAVEANINTSNFTFLGTAADYILDNYVPLYGVFNGCYYRIEVFDPFNPGNVEVAFDGFIVLSEYQLNSKEFPKLLECPVRAFDNNITAFDRASILTQGLLQHQGFIQQSDFIDLALVEVSKLGAKDRAVAIANLAFQVFMFFANAVQNFLSAIADILGLSAAIGLVELATLFLSLLIEIQQLADLIISHKDLLLASQTWHKVIGLKTVIERAFEKFGFTVDFGEIDPVISKIYLKGSENGIIGDLTPGGIGSGILKRQDYGYLISEDLALAKDLFNTRQDIQGSVVHIKNKKDPFWQNSPTFTPADVLIESTSQYENGFYRNKTEDVFATWRGAYQYDSSDAWTLTEKNGDSFEVHRELITELDPRTNTLKGLKDVQPSVAMAVRYDATETVLALLADVFASFGGNLDQFQGIITQFSTFIDSAAGVDSAVADALALSPLNFFFAVSPGGLKVEDNTFAVTKLVYADTVTLGNVSVLNIPVNFKSFIGMEPIYNNYYLPDSPAQENNFEGQYTESKEVAIPFAIVPYQQTKLNPYFVLVSNNAKFEHIAWIEDGHKAEVDIEVNEPFDTNIKETVIP